MALLIIEELFDLEFLVIQRENALSAARELSVFSGKGDILLHY